LPEPFAFAQDPLVVAPLQQVRRVQLDGVAQPVQSAVGAVLLRPRDRLFEGRDVEPDGGVGSPLKGARRDLEERSA
jgi:hypothetical protein